MMMVMMMMMMMMVMMMMILVAINAIFVHVVSFERDAHNL